MHNIDDIAVGAYIKNHKKSGELPVSSKTETDEFRDDIKKLILLENKKRGEDRMLLECLVEGIDAGPALVAKPVSVKKSIPIRTDLKFNVREDQVISVRTLNNILFEAQKKLSKNQRDITLIEAVDELSEIVAQSILTGQNKISTRQLSKGCRSVCNL